MKSFFLKLTWANLIAKPLSTFLTIATLATAVSLISIMIQFSNHTSERLSRDLAGVDLVVGAKGSPLQLILSSLIHVDVPTGNIPLSEAQKLMASPMVRAAVPLALGDSFRGFRIVGTHTDYVDLYNSSLATGRLWNKPHEVVIGAEVSRQLNMQIGQQFVSAHGLSYDDEDLNTHDHAAFEVVGILEPSASIIDQLILTSVDSVWHAHGVDVHEGHDHDEAEEHDHDHNHEAEGLSAIRTMDAANLEITALLIQYSSPIAAVTLPRAINDTTALQAAAPAIEITRLYNLSSGLTDAAKLLAIIMTAIGGLSIFVAFSNAAVHKIYDIALLRAMGAKPGDVFMLQLLEGVIVSSFSGLVGIGLAHMLLALAAIIYVPIAVFGLNGSAFYDLEVQLFFGTIVVGMIATIWPALNSYRVDPMLLIKGKR